VTGLRGLAALDDAIAAIEADPRNWTQRWWRCKSGMCLAGHLAVRSGGTWAHGPRSPYGTCLVPLPGEIVTMKDHRSQPVVHVQDRAGRILGFSRQLTDGRDLFAASNTLADLKAIQADLHAAEGTAKWSYLVRERAA
jgi:hypothetical protein